MAVWHLDAAGFDRDVAAALYLDAELLMTQVDPADRLARSSGEGPDDSLRSPDDLTVAAPSSAPMSMDKSPASQSTVNRRMDKP
jgi:hypothetical protein